MSLHHWDWHVGGCGFEGLGTQNCLAGTCALEVAAGSSGLLDLRAGNCEVGSHVQYLGQ